MRVTRYCLKSLFIFIILWPIVIFFVLRSYTVRLKPKQLEWFLSNGAEYPKENNGFLKLFHHQYQGDRIVEQLMYVPSNYNRSTTKKKKIVICYGNMDMSPQTMFEKCPVSSCTATKKISEAKTADALLFLEGFRSPSHERFPEQIWIMYALESPFNGIRTSGYDDVFNWTATYRRDSDIVTPYGKWVYYDYKVQEKFQGKNYAVNKTKHVAWFVSNCMDHNGRLSYAMDLKNYISVHIYGACGSFTCPISDSTCFTLLKEYKFYLSFENSNCRDYITEKFFSNALEHNVIPVVMGPSKEDYAKAAPKNSFIHVSDFKSPKELASYLLFLSTNDVAYNSYFHWIGTGELINTHFWCRLCAMLHSPYKSKSYNDISTWWNGPDVCTK